MLPIIITALVMFEMVYEVCTFDNIKLVVRL